MAYGSNSNILMVNADQSSTGWNAPLTGVQVSIAFTESLQCVTSVNGSGPQSPPSCSFQLNCWSELNPDKSLRNDTWQQYVFIIAQNADGSGYTISSMIDNWPSKQRAKSLGPSAGGGLINSTSSSWNRARMTTMVVPDLKQSRLVIGLNTQADGTVYQIMFTIFNDANRGYQSATVDLQDLLVNAPGQTLVGASDLAPITAFQVVLVGQDVARALLGAGAGTITYRADNTVIPERLDDDPNLPKSADDHGVITYETANSWYDEPVANADGSYTQAFGVSVYPAGGFLAAAPDQGVAGQADLFAVDTHGHLTWFTAPSAKPWNGYAPISPYGFKAPAGAPLAVSPQFGSSGQTDVFVADTTGAINVFFKQNAGGWALMQPALTGAGVVPPGAALAASQRFGVADQTDVYAVNASGQLVVWSVIGGGAWSRPVLISNPASFSAPPGAWVAATQQLGADNQTDVFVVDNTGTLCVFFINGAGNAWRGPHPIAGPNFAPPGAFVAAGPHIGIANRTDVYVVDNTGTVHGFWVVAAGPWNDALIPAVGPFALPGAPMAQSPQPGASNQTDVFVVDQLGSLGVYWAEGQGGWSSTPKPFSPVGLAQLFPTRYVAAGVQAGADAQTDLFMMLPVSGNSGPAWPSVWFVQGAGHWQGSELLVYQA